MHPLRSALWALVLCVTLHPLSAHALNTMVPTLRYAGVGLDDQSLLFATDSYTPNLEARLFPCSDMETIALSSELPAVFKQWQAESMTQAALAPAEVAMKQAETKIDDDAAMKADEIPWDQYLYAGHVRYTVDGMPALRNSHINYLALGITSGVYLGIMVGLHIYQMNTFWADRSSRINILEDGSYAKGVDKFGHVFGATMMSYASTQVLQGSGVSVESSHIWGTLMGILYQTYVEIEDGYGRQWGFSPTDMYMNMVGATYYLSQYYIPALQNVTEKWIYTPAPWIHEQARASSETFIDDYSSSTFFYSFKMVNIFPDAIASHWPRWLNLAFGYAARGLDTPQEDTKLVFALDYDFPELFPDFRQTVGGALGDGLNWVIQTLNYIKFPSPAIEIGSHGMTRFNLLYPFKLSVGSLRF